MTSEELKILQGAMMTLGDPRGNWAYAWKILCELAQMDPVKCNAPFKAHPVLSTLVKPELAGNQSRSDMPSA